MIYHTISLLVIVICFSFYAKSTIPAETPVPVPPPPPVVVTPSPSMPVIDLDQMECLALNIYHEARGDDRVGQLAVADVTLNRVKDPRYPNTICEVVKQAVMSEWYAERGMDVPVRNKCQFSWYCDGRDDTPYESAAWISAQQIADSLLRYSKDRGIASGATHYHAVYVSPAWAYDRGMAMVGQIGDHYFYKWH